MLPGGMMPVTHVVAMLRSSPPQHAAGLLASMPADRMRAALAAMEPADIARVLGGMKPQNRPAVLTSLPPEQVARVLLLLSIEQAAGLLSALPEEWILAIVNVLPAPAVPVLIMAMDPERQAALMETMDPRWSGGLAATMYEQGVAQAVGRTNATVSTPNREYTGDLLVETFGRLITVTARYHEHGDFTLAEIRQCQEVAARMQAHGALAVTNAPLSNEVLDYIDAARARNWLIDAVTWIDQRYDGILQRTLVGLIR